MNISILLSLFYFFYFAIIGVYIIFMPKILSMSGYGASEIGIIFATAPLIKFLMPFAFTRGLKLNKTTFNIALIILLFSALSFYISIYNFYELVLSNIFFGIGLSLILPYIEVISLETIGKERYGKVRLFGSVGFVLVALILVKFLSSAEVAISYLVTLSFLTAFVAFYIVKNIQNIEKKSEHYENGISLLADWRLWAGLTLMQVSFGSFYNFFTIYETDYGVSLDMTIYLWSFGVLAEIFMLYYQGKLLKGNLLLLLQVTTFVTAMRWVLLFMFPQNLSVLFFAQSLHALSFALFHSSAITYLFYKYKNRSLAQQFFSGITYGLGGFSGALIAGHIYESYPSYLFLSSAFIALMATVLITLHRRRESTRNQLLD